MYRTALPTGSGCRRSRQVTMTIRHFVGVVFWIVIAPAAAICQQSGQKAGPGPTGSMESTVILEFRTGSALPSRHVETRSVSGDREVRAETVETPDPDGRLKPSQETITETIRRAPNVVRARRDVEYVAFGHRTLVETSESEQEILLDGSRRTVQSTSVPDLNGSLHLILRQVRQTKSIARDVKQTDTTLFQLGTDRALQESERLQQIESQVRPDSIRTESTRSIRDLNGRFQTIERRSLDVRTVGASQELREETVDRLDVDGRLVRNERNVSRRTVVNGQDQIVIETWSRNIGAVIRTDNRMELSQRVRRTTTTAADGGGQTIEEVYARNPVSQNEPMRMIQRTVETIRKVDAKHWQTERQLFIVDVNGRWVIATTETEERAER